MYSFLATPSSGSGSSGSGAVGASTTVLNRLINGDFKLAQYGASNTVTAGTAVPTAAALPAGGYPCCDRWFAYSTGANVTAAQVAGTGTTRNRLQITGAASVTAIGVGQRIEDVNSFDLNNGSISFGVDLANSLLTTVTWTLNYANTANAFGTIGTPTKTQIATGNFTVNSTVTRYTATVSVPAAATTGMELIFTVGAQTSGTWTIGNVQLEAGATANAFSPILTQQQQQAAYRYFWAPSLWVTGTGTSVTYTYPTTMRAVPTITGAGAGFATTANTVNGVLASQTTGALQSLTFAAEIP